jgi:phosphoglycolate phosphatase
VLHKNGIADRFHATRCADEGMPKPHPDMLIHIMDRLGAQPSETLMIGDTTHDLELARNAGVASVAVSYGAHQVDGFARFQPLATLHSMAELRGWLVREG